MSPRMPYTTQSLLSIALTSALAVPLGARAAESVPPGWFKAGSAPQHYETGTSTEDACEGPHAAFVQARDAAPPGHGTLMTVDATVAVTNLLPGGPGELPVTDGPANLALGTDEAFRKPLVPAREQRPSSALAQATESQDAQGRVGRIVFDAGRLKVTPPVLRMSGEHERWTGPGTDVRAAGARISGTLLQAPVSLDVVSTATGTRFTGTWAEQPRMALAGDALTLERVHDGPEVTSGCVAYGERGPQLTWKNTLQLCGSATHAAPRASSSPSPSSPSCSCAAATPGGAAASVATSSTGTAPGPRTGAPTSERSGESGSNARRSAAGACRRGPSDGRASLN
jgi:hypothetical protein